MHLNSSISCILHSALHAELLQQSCISVCITIPLLSSIVSTLLLRTNNLDPGVGASSAGIERSHNEDDMASTDFDSPLETFNQAAPSPSLRGGFNYLFENDGTFGDLFGDDVEEESLFVEDDHKGNAALDSYQGTLVVDFNFSPSKSAVKNRVEDIRSETKDAPVIKQGIVRKITKSAAKLGSHWVFEIESEEGKDPLAALKLNRISARKNNRKHACHSSSEEQDEKADSSLCESLKEKHARDNDRHEGDLQADSLADRIKRSRRNSRVISIKEKIPLEVKDYKGSPKQKESDNTIISDNDHTRHPKRNVEFMRSSSMAKGRSNTTTNTAVNQQVIILSDFSSPEKRKRGALEEHRTTRKSSGPRPKRTCATIASTTTSVGMAKHGHQAAGTSRRPLERATSAANAMTVERALQIQASPDHRALLNPAFRSRLLAQKTNRAAPASKALSQPNATRIRTDSGVDMSPTNVDIATGLEYNAAPDYISMFDKRNGKHTRVSAGLRRVMAAVPDGGVANLICVSPARSYAGIAWTGEELEALGVSPLRKPILSPKRMKTVSFNVPRVYKSKSHEATHGIQSLVDSESEVPGLSENKSTSEAETWIETPGHTSEDGTSANSQSAQDGHPANPQSALTTEDAQAAVILAHLPYASVLGQRERAGIIEEAFNDAVRQIVLPRRWVFMNGALDGITDATPSSQLFIILESEVALIEAQYNIQRSRSQHFTPAHAIFWNQVLLPIKRFLNNYRAANMVITRNDAETILLALSREDLVSQLDMIAQKNLQDSTREVIAAMGLLSMGKIA